MTTPYPPTETASPQNFELGVLFVHGIGGQRQGDTLTTWGDAIGGWLERWGPGCDPPQPVRFSNTRLRSDEAGPPRATLHIGEGESQVTWLLTEAWWADEFTTPSFAKLATWSIKTVPIVLLGHAVGAIRRGVTQTRTEPGLNRFFALGQLGVTLIVVVPLTLLLAPFVVALLLLLLALGLLPIPPVRNLVAKVQRSLTGAVGDSLILLESPIQGAAMKSRINAGVQHLRSRRCAKIVIVAHSQGAAITERALAESTDLSPIDAIVTVGSGINKLEEARRATELGLTSWFPPIALLVTAALALWLRADLKAGVVELWRLAAAFGSLMAVVVLTAALSSVLRRVKERTRTAILVAEMLTMVAALLVAARFVGVGFWRTYVMLIAPALGAAALYRRFSIGDLPLSSKVRRSVRNWFDLYARSDPVSNGPMIAARLEPDEDEASRSSPWLTSLPVRNLDSMFRDHSTYVHAQDDALPKIAHVLLEQAGGPHRLSETDLRYLRRAANHRAWRVSWLRGTRWVVLIAITIFVVRTWSDLPSMGPAIYAAVLTSVPDLPTWFPPSLDVPASRLAGIAAVVVVGGLLYLLGGGVWSVWNRREMRLVFEREEPQTKPRLLRGLIATWFLILTAAYQADAWVRDLARLEWSNISLGDVLEDVAFLGWLLFLYAGLIPWLVDKTPLSRRHVHERKALV